MARNFTNIYEAGDILNDMSKAMKYIKENYVLVGIPEHENEREAQSPNAVTNAELLYIHTFGSPARNIPKRPVIEPAIEKNKDKLADLLKDALESYMDGNTEAAEKFLKIAGMKAQSVSRGWFTNPENGWPENSERVKQAKMKKGSTNPRPLIDTGELRKSITYVIVKDGKEQ